MAAVSRTGLGGGTRGVPQPMISESLYPSVADEIEIEFLKEKTPKYHPSDKHDPRYGWGSEDPIVSEQEGQELLESGYKHGKQIYNITHKGEIVKFQPDGTADNGYHCYKVNCQRDVPASVLRSMLKDNRITRAQYNKFRKGDYN